jgi:hypothetical protein
MPREILHEAKPTAEERLPWHTPEIERLTISFDTGFDVQAPASVTDLELSGPKSDFAQG